MRRRAAAADLVTSGPLADGQPLPLVLRPQADVEIVAWAQASRAWLERELVEHGALLFRGFSVSSPAVFERLALVFVPELLDYVEGTSPRTLLADGLYTSTEYPPDQFISLHHELSYAHRFPARVFFHCVTAPATGGETPLADGRRVLELMPPDLAERFSRRGVRYERNMHAGQGPGLSWSSVFETDRRDIVEGYCREGEVEFRWKPDGGLWTSQVRPGVITHPETGDRVWFNQADQWHPSSLGGEVHRAMVSIGGGELPLNATYGDGSAISAEELDQVRDVVRQATVTFPWQAGDVMMVDNLRVAHGRMPFAGPRRVLVAMGRTVSLRSVS